MKNHGKLNGLVSVVTGSGRGIGKNVARALGLAGAQVVICDIDQETGKRSMADLQGQGIAADYFSVDLSCRGEPQRMIRQIAQRYGGLDILVNNARSGRRMTMLEEDDESWEKGLAVTLKAAFFAAQEAIRVMGESNGGRIVNISSVAAHLTCNESPAYHIAKAGLVQMTRYLAAHAGKYRVRVNAVLPGFIVQDEHRTHYEGENNRHYRAIAEFCHPMGQVGESNMVADAVLFLCSPDASFITGQCLIVDGGLTLQEQSGLVYRFSQRGS